MKPVFVHDYLWDAAKYPPQPICAVFGDDPFLRSNAVRHLKDQVLAAADAEFALTRFDGDDKSVLFKNVLKELQTVAMFGGGRRLVCIDDADSFVTKYRTELENYAANPSQQAILILQLKTFPATTKLYKQIAESGLLIEEKKLKQWEIEKERPQWILRWSKHHYETVCDLDAAEMIVQRIGTEYGLLDQELSKLSLMAADKKRITAELVERAVGSWRSRTAFEMLDLALAGQTAAAIRQLDALILAGEECNRILGGITYNLRPLAVATEYILDAERRKTKTTVRSALEKAGVKGFVLGKAEGQLLKLGRHRGAKLLDWLLQLDLDLKGESRSDPRLLLERFIVRISSEKLREPLKQ